MKQGFVYLLSNKGRTLLYIGATKDLKVRISLHKKGKGAQFTNKYKVHDLLYFEEFKEYKEAFIREKQLKNWRKEWKWNLIKTKNPELTSLNLDEIYKDTETSSV